MYQFSTIEGLVFTTTYSPKQISKYIHFDAFDGNGDRFIIQTKDVDFRTFEYLAT